MTDDRVPTAPLLTRIRDRRAACAQRRRLAAELALFSTDADRLELDAMLERAPERDADYVRRVLAGTRSYLAA